MASAEIQSLEELRAATAAFNKKWTVRGGRLTTYCCGHCQQRIETRQPRRQDVGPRGFWDSMTTCTGCGGLNFVTVYPDGHATAVKF